MCAHQCPQAFVYGLLLPGVEFIYNFAQIEPCTPFSSSVVKDHDEPKVAGGHAGCRVDSGLQALEIVH